MKKWRCTVCGYIHAGDTPPEKCPVCGADKDLFEEESEATANEEMSAASDEGITESRQATPNLFAQQILKHHIHPVAAHIPNGVFPVSVLFIIVSLCFGYPVLQEAAKYNMAFVLLILPIVILTGYIEWKNHYMGNFSRLFIAKIVAATVTTVAFTFVVVWWFLNPNVLQSPLPQRGAFILLNIIGLVATGCAGFIGGKLVFKD